MCDCNYSADLPSRQHPFNCANKEVALVGLPCNRTKMQTKDRATFAGAGEESTHAASYTNIPIPRRAQLPLMQLPEKLEVFPSVSPGEGAAPKGWLESRSSGAPLFWYESKGHALWKQLLTDFDLTAVVDLTPGSGQLGRACLAAGAQYFGICANQTHMSWLANVLDRYALEHIVESGSHLYQESLSTHIQEHFANLLQQLHEADADDGPDAEILDDIID